MRISAVELAVAAAVISVAAFFLSSASSYRRTLRRLSSHVRELQASLDAEIEKGAAERRGRVRAQQALRKALAEQIFDGPTMASSASYPMAPIGTVRSCFSTRNGTPRQPLLVPLARARLVFEQVRVPPQALEGLVDYSHCWILYVFHLNTDLDKLWKQPSRSKFKAKVRVPILKGGKMGVFATRSPHRPCPIGLTLAKVEAVDGHEILFSGVDLVDGTPVLDIKPYLPYSDSIIGATIPKWLEINDTLTVASVSFSEEFAASLSNSWVTTGKQSLYASAEEFQRLIKEVLSWDIRSQSQRSRPHQSVSSMVGGGDDDGSAVDPCQISSCRAKSKSTENNIIYHLILEGVDVSYRIDSSSNVVVEKASSLL